MLKSRKIISLMLVFTMIFSMLANVYAVDGISSNHPIPKIFSKKIGDMTIYNIYEGDIHDELVIYDNGKIVLNDKEVKVSNKSPSQIYTPYINGEQIQHAPVSIQQRWTQTVPFGSSSDYVRYLRTDRNFDIQLSQAIHQITLTSIIRIILQVLGLPTVATHAFRNLVSAIVRSSPYSEHLSYKSDVYVHRVYGLSINSSLSVERHDMSLYSDRSYQGIRAHETWYKETRTYMP